LVAERSTPPVVASTIEVLARTLIQLWARLSTKTTMTTMVAAVMATSKYSATRSGSGTNPAHR